MVEIIGVRFNDAGKIYYFNPKGQSIRTGTSVLVETSRGVEMGRVVIPNKDVDESEIVPPLREIVRLATKDDFRQVEENKELEKEAYKIAVGQIREHKIDMKLVDVEYTFDRSKILFYFTADGRVDFRELVKSLAGIFHTRIELRQIGVRDEARQIGSYGICGRYLCCGTFLDDFRPVSIKMSKEQGLSLNPAKISGTCGRLMCCLQYEQNVYEEMLRKLPKRGETVETADGVGKVADVMTLKGEIRVKFEIGDGVKFENYSIGNFKVVGTSKGAEEVAESEDIFVKETEEISEATEKQPTQHNNKKKKRNKNKKPHKEENKKQAINPVGDDPEAK